MSEVDDIRETLRSQLHEREWFETYRAAVRGRSAADSDYERVHEFASAVANRAHGRRWKPDTTRSAT